MSELRMLTELKELTEQKSPNQNKQRALVRLWLQAVGTATKSTIHIIVFFFLNSMERQKRPQNAPKHKFFLIYRTKAKYFDLSTDRDERHIKLRS